MANSDIIKIGFDYRASLAQFEKDTNGVFDGISNKAGKQRITIQLDAKDDKVIEKIKELQKLKLDKFTFEFGDSGLKEQLKTFGQLENKINKIITLSKGIGNNSSPIINISDTTKQIDKLENKISELTNKYDELQKKSSSIGSENISGNNISLIDNEEFKSLTLAVENTKQEIDMLKASISELESNDTSLINFTDRLDEELINVSNSVNKLTRDILTLQEALKSTSSNKTNISSGRKDAFPKTSENLEQVTQSEQKVQQEAVATDKALDNISFTPNTEGFDDIIAKFGILREQAEQITKIVKTTKQTADGTPDISYKATLRNGSSYYLGGNSTPQVLNANEIVYDAKAVAKNWEQAEKAIQNYMNAITELNNLKTKDKGTGKNSSEIANQVKEVERLKTIAYEAKETLSSIANSNKADTTTWNKWLNVMKQFEQASLGTTQSVAKLEDALRNANNSQINYMNSVVQRFQNNLDKYSADVKREGYKPSNDFINAVSEYESKVNHLRLFVENLSKTKIVDQKQIDSFKQLTQSAEEYKKALQNMSASEKGMKFVSIQKEIDKINQILRENPKFCKEAKNELKSLMNQLMSSDPTANLEKIHTRVMEIKNAEELAGRAGKNFLNILASKSYYGFIGQLQSYMSMYVGFYGIMNSIKSGLSTIRELDTSLTEMRKVSDETVQTLKDYQKESFNTADAIATSGLQMQNSIADWQRLGYSIKEANELAKNSNIYKNVGDMDISTETEHMVSSVQAWKSEFNDDAVKTSEEVMNRYNKIGNEFAISSADIGEAMETSAAALKAGGNDLNEALGIITAGNIIQQEASTTSSAMKILSLRIRGAKADLESMGESTDDLADSTSKLRDEIKSLTGVDIMADEDTFKSTAEIIKEVGAVWNHLSDVSQAATLEKLAGKNRASTVAGLIENYETIDKVIEAASNADNSALDENQKVIESIDGRIQQLSNRVQEFWQTVINGDSIKWIIDSTTTVLEVLTNIISKLHLIPTLLGGIGAGIAIKNVGEHYIVPVSI